jgi:hypothetical protein
MQAVLSLFAIPVDCEILEQLTQTPKFVMIEF